MTTKPKNPKIPDLLATMTIREFMVFLQHRRTLLHKPNNETREYARAINVLNIYVFGGKHTTVGDLIIDWDSFCVLPGAGKHTLKFIQSVLTELGAKDLPEINK